MVEFTVFKGSKNGKIVKGKTVKDLGPNEVLLEITHSGLCGTDIHYKNVDMALGHEGVGIVKQVGSNVTLFKVYGPDAIRSIAFRTIRSSANLPVEASVPAGATFTPPAATANNASAVPRPSAWIGTCTARRSWTKVR